MKQKSSGTNAPAAGQAAGVWPARRRLYRPILPQLLELLGIIVFIVVFIQVVGWLWERTTPKEVTVPKVLGLTQQQAERVLKAAGLESEVVAEKSDEKVPEGEVLLADPTADRTVKAGRIVRLTLSAGSRWAVVPDVTQMSVDRARALLRQANLGVGREKAQYHTKVPLGYVISHVPAAEKHVPRNTEVDLLVSKGPKPDIERAEDQPQLEGTRSTEIDLVIPPGASLQEVKIIVHDRRGERVAYTGYHEPGERVLREISGEGSKVVVQVYLSGLLVEERSI